MNPVEEHETISRRGAIRLGLATITAVSSAGSLHAEEPPKTGAIYAFARFENRRRKPNSGLFRVDPNAMTWTNVIDEFDQMKLGDVRVSPDGKQVAFTRSTLVKVQNGGRATQERRLDSVWIQDLQGGMESREIREIVGAPFWSGDGKHLVLVGHVGLRGSRTWRIGADGSDLRQLPIPETDQVCDVSPDGTWVITTRLEPSPAGKPGYQIDRVNIDGTGRQRLTDSGSNISPRLSPDGRRLAYCKVNPGDLMSLEVVDIGGEAPRTLYREEDNKIPETPCWSPDGRQLCFVMKTWAAHGKVRQLDPSVADPRLCLLRADGEDLRVVTHDPLDWVVSPDWR